MPQAQKAIRLGDWLLDRGLVTQTQLDLALREQKRKGWLLGESLTQLGFVTQETLSQFLAQKTQTESIDLAAIVISPEMVKIVPEALARRLVAVPVSREDATLTVAISDPLNVTAFDVLEQATRLQVNLVAAPEGDILLAIERLYASGQTIEEIIDELMKLGSDRLATTTEQDAPMIRLVDRIIAEGVNGGSSDIHIHPEEKILRVRLRRDGVLTSGYLAPKEIQPALIARLKIIGGMDIAENRRPQGGRANVTVASREVGLRFSTLPTAYGESIVIRILDRNSISLNLKALGFSPEIETGFRSVLDKPHGVILVTGPTGSGKTTTLYTALSLIDGTENSIFTLEDPVEYQLPLVRQTQVNEAVGLTFAEGLRTLLRQDPDVILVGETRDTETAQLMVRAALTGHLVFSTLHTNDAIGAIPRLIDLGVEPYLLAPTLIGVLAQRLVRRLCPKCRIVVADPLAKLQGLKVTLPGGDLPPTLWESGGCPECSQTGYRGRVGIHEFFPMDVSYHAAIVNGLDMAKLQALAKERGFATMFYDGLNKSLRGLTTLEEVLRVSQP
ncbi:MAG: type II/IV secretion system protein [Verrucomicrobia bacterium]|jgi:type IV pilus assembly protein PilB|nr:type II/IV secretion system protein [Verrucomicrobiota bacterium]